MIYGPEQLIQYPVKDLYDKQIMAMSIAAAKDMYEKGQLQIKDFLKEYGDFMSPIQKDMDWYNLNVTGKVRDTINNLYANGIDPLRSAEGRAAISLLIYSMPTGNISKVRQSAEAAKEYIKNRGVLEASGKWDPNFERFANQGMMLEDWDTIGGGNVWNRTSPAELKTLKELTEPWYNQRTAHMLDKAGVESFGMQYDPKYQYTGFTEQDLLDIAAGQTPGWNGSIYADYYRDVARRKVQAMKNLRGDRTPVTNSEIERQLQQDVAIANREYKILPTKEADQFALDDYRTRNDMRAHAANKAVDHKYWKLEHGDDIDKYNRVFRRAELLTSSDTSLAGDLVLYTPQEQYSQWIDPVNQGGQRNVKLESGEIVPSYQFSANVMKQSGSIYKLGDDGKFYASRVPSASGDYTFVPDGNMRSRRIGKKGNKELYKYYISGMLLDPSARVVTNDGDNVAWIAVKERDHNYGQNQKKE